MGHGHGEEAAAQPPPPPEEEPPAVLVREGWLTKKGGKQGFLGMASWKKRWFQMTSTSLAYFEKPGTGVKGGVLLEGVTACRPATDAECNFPNGFIIDTKDDRTYVMHAATIDERDAWLTDILAAVEALKPVPKSKAAPAIAKPPKFDDPIEIGYWKIRGLGAPLRMMCFYAGYKKVEFPMYELTEKSEAEGGGWDASEWLCDSAKFALAKSNALINLPYIVNKQNNQVISQSSACMTYLGRRLNLMGTEEDMCANEQLLGELVDMNSAAVKMFYTTDIPVEYEKYFGSSVTTSCNKFVAWLDQRKTKFLVGSEPMVADFRFFEYLDQHELISKHIFGRDFLQSSYPRLAQYHADFRALPQLKTYFESEYPLLPINNKKAKIGGSILAVQLGGEGADPATSAPLYDMADAGDGSPRKPVYE